MSHRKFAVVKASLVSLLLSLLLASCGEGGGGSGTPSLSSSVSSITISANENETFRDSNFTITVNNLNQRVYLAVDSSTNSIGSMNTNYGTTSANVQVVFKSAADLGVGNYSDQIVVYACLDYYCNSQIQNSPLTINVNYNVNKKLHLPYSSMYFDRILGHSAPLPYDAGFEILGTDINWSISVDQPWVTIDTPNGTSPSTIQVGINDSGFAEGTYTATMTLVNEDQPSETIAIPLTYTVSQPDIPLFPNVIDLGGQHGMDHSAGGFYFGLSTGSNAYPYTITTAPGSWIALDNTTGMVSDIMSHNIVVDADRSGLTPGNHTDTFELNVNVNGAEIKRTITVNLYTPAHDLLVSDTGIALVSTTGLGKLSDSVKVIDTYDITTTPWTASSNQVWLSVTGSGSSGDDLVLTADPTGLTTDTVHYASVTLSSSDSSLGQLDSIKVGFWVSAAASNSSETISQAYSQLEADPIRPYVYAHNGGSSIDVYNIYSAALVTTINNVASSAGDMAITGDGRRLFVYDESNNSVVPIDLPGFTVGTPWALESPPTSNKFLEISRTKGLEVLFASNGKAYYPDTGLVLQTVAENSTDFATQLYGNRMISASHDGSRVCERGVETNSSAGLQCYSLEYNREVPAKLMTLKLTSSSHGYSFSGARDIATSPDGSLSYIAHGSGSLPGTPYYFTIYAEGSSAPTPAYLDGDPYPNNIEVMADGEILAGMSSLYGPADIYHYGVDGNLLGSYDFSGYANTLLNRQLKVSGDGLRILALSDEPALRIINR